MDKPVKSIAYTMVNQFMDVQSHISMVVLRYSSSLQWHLSQIPWTKPWLDSHRLWPSVDKVNIIVIMSCHIGTGSQHCQLFRAKSDRSENL